MSGYRFCRTDDVPLLVEAHNRCYAVNFRGAPPMTVADFKRGSKELDLWASSCMVAFADHDPIGVLLSAKRETESLVYRIGVHPDHQRQGHGAHLIRSLSRKLTILGPARLVAEIPIERTGIREFFAACDFHVEARYADFISPARQASTEVGAVAVTLAEIVEAGAWETETPRSWQRSHAALAKRSLEGLALVSDVRIEAWILHGECLSGGREVVALGGARDARRHLLGLLLRHICALQSQPVSIPRISEGELEFALLESWGFRRGQEYVGYAVAEPGE